MTHHLRTTKQLHDLPLELIIQIFTQVPPQYMFSLRSVSKGWNNMLRNPSLEAAVMDSLPFLTTAPNLESRIRRRMRILHNEPVRVMVDTSGNLEPFTHHMFPSFCSHGRTRSVFSDGYTIAMFEPEITSRNFRRIMLWIVNRRKAAFVAEVNLLETIELKYPGLYELLLRSPAFSDSGYGILFPRLLLAQGPLVIVFLEVVQTWGRSSWIRSHGFLVFLFSLTTGSLIQSWKFDKVGWAENRQIPWSISYGTGVRFLIDAKINQSFLVLGLTDRETERLEIETYSIATGQLQCRVERRLHPVAQDQPESYRHQFIKKFALDTSNNIYYLDSSDESNIHCLGVISAKNDCLHPTANPLRFLGDDSNLGDDFMCVCHIGAWDDKMFLINLPVCLVDDIEPYLPPGADLCALYYSWKAHDPKRTMKKHTVAWSPKFASTSTHSTSSLGVKRCPPSTAYGLWGYVPVSGEKPQIFVLSSVTGSERTCQQGILVRDLLKDIDILKSEEGFSIAWREGDDGVMIWKITCPGDSANRLICHVALIYDEDYVF